MMKKVVSYNEIRNYMGDEKKLKELFAIHEVRSSHTCTGSCCNFWTISYTFKDLSSVQSIDPNGTDKKVTLLWSNGSGLMQEPTKVER